MQVNSFPPSLTNTTESPREQAPRVSRKRFQPHFARLDLPPKKKPFTVFILEYLNIDPHSGTTVLHTAIKSGDYETALTLIKQHFALDVHENVTGFTPLHCLSYFPWDTEQFFDLLTALLKKGCSPNAKSYTHTTFLDCLANAWNLNASDYREIFRIISAHRYTFYLPHAEMPSFLIKHAAATNIPLEERVETLLDFFSYIPAEHKQKAADKLLFQILKSHQFEDRQLSELIELLLKKWGATFNPALSKDTEGSNLIGAYLEHGNPFSHAQEKARIFKMLAESGVDIHNCQRGATLFEAIITSPYSFQMKKELLQELLNVDLQWSISLHDSAHMPTGKPNHVVLIDYLVDTGLRGNEISELVKMFYKKKWYEEYLYLKLIANCFSSPSEWFVEDGTVSLPGALCKMTEFYRWLELEAQEFYDNAMLSKQTMEHILGQIEALLSSDAKKVLNQISLAKWCGIWNETGRLLSHAYYPNKLPYHPLTPLSEGRMLAFIPSLRTENANCNHMIGLLFKPGEILFCNKGDDLTKRAGISRHAFTSEKINTIFQEALQGVRLYPFIRDHFHDRIEEETGKAPPFIAHQKPQEIGNCPVASFSSLEFGILISLLQQTLPLADPDSIVEIARSIKKVHRLQRRKRLIHEYEVFHQQENLNLPSYLPFMNNLRLDPMPPVIQEEKPVPNGNY